MNREQVLEHAQMYENLKFEAQKKVFVISQQQRLPQQFVNSRNMLEREQAED